MNDEKFIVIATTEYLGGGKVTVVIGMCSDEQSAKSKVEALTKEYKEEREKDKTLPKVVYSYSRM